MYSRRGLNGGWHDLPIVLSVDHVHGIIGLSQPGSCGAHHLQGMFAVLLLSLLVFTHFCLTYTLPHGLFLDVITHCALYLLYHAHFSLFFICTFLNLQVKALLLYMLKCVVDGNRTLQVKTKPL